MLQSRLINPPPSQHCRSRLYRRPAVDQYDLSLTDIELRLEEDVTETVHDLDDEDDLGELLAVDDEE